MIKKILIGVDDSSYAENAAKYGFKLAETLGAHVGLVHMVEPTPLPTTTTGADVILGTPMQGLSNTENMELLNVQNEISEALLTNIAKGHTGKLQITQFNEYGSTGEGIISCSHEFNADLIVVGTHKRSGFDRLLMGDTAEYIVRHSSIPVLVVPFNEK